MWYNDSGIVLKIKNAEWDKSPSGLLFQNEVTFLRGYRIDGSMPREIYLGGREIYDLSRLREQPVKGAEDASVNKGEVSPETQEDTLPAESAVFQPYTGQSPVETAAATVQEKKKENKPEVRLPHEFQDFSETLRDLKEPITVTILHTNDIHGNILPRQDFSNGSTSDKKLNIGGEAAAATIITNERKQAAEKGEDFLLLDAGDMAMGTSLSGMFEGKPMIEVMNKQGYDAATLGNHDFDWGVDALQNMIQNADFPFLAANIKDKHGKPLPNTQPFVIKELPGLKVGLVGVITPETAEISNDDNVRQMDFQDPVASLSATIPEMKRQGAELIVVLSHSGLEQDKRIAEKVKGVDLIVGGHSHHTLDKPIEIGKTLIVQTGFGGRNIGKVQLTWDPSKKQVIKGNGSLIPVDGDKVNPDREITSIINKYSQKLDSIMNVKLGESKEDMVQPHSGKETNLGNIVTDMMREEAGTDIALLNSGCLRTNLMKGEIRFKDIYNVIPFASKIVSLKMKGRDLLKVLEQSAGREDDKVLQVSGLQVIYDSSKPEGQRVHGASTEDGIPIEPEKEYSVATIDYLAKGGDQYTAFTKAESVKTTSEILTDAVAKQVKNRGVLMAGLTNRIQNIA